MPLRRRAERLPYQVVYTDKVLRKARKKAGPNAVYLVTRATIRRELDMLVAVGWEVIEHAAGQILGTTSSGTYTLRMRVDSPDNCTYEERITQRERAVHMLETAGQLPHDEAQRVADEAERIDIKLPTPSGPEVGWEGISAQDSPKQFYSPAAHEIKQEKRRKRGTRHLMR
jgi:hypothetical protein